MAGFRIRDIALLGPLLAAVAAGTVAAIGGRDAESGFLDAQDRRPAGLSAAEVERAVRTAPDPRTGRGRGRSARCRSRGSRALGNPWSCTVTYASGGVRLTVRIAEHGSYTGRYAGGGRVRGCCLRLP
jgi:hypothetical protein